MTIEGEEERKRERGRRILVQKRQFCSVTLKWSNDPAADVKSFESKLRFTTSSESRFAIISRFHPSLIPWLSFYIYHLKKVKIKK